MSAQRIISRMLVYLLHVALGLLEMFFVYGMLLAASVPNAWYHHISVQGLRMGRAGQHFELFDSIFDT